MCIIYLIIFLLILIVLIYVIYSKSSKQDEVEGFTSDVLDKVKNSNSWVSVDEHDLQIKKGLTNNNLLTPVVKKDLEKFDINTVCTKENKSCFNVRTDTQNPEITHQIFSEIDLMIRKLIYIMDVKYLKEDTRGEPLYNDEYKKMLVKNMKQRYNGDNIIENITDNPDRTSYVVNKGKVMALCVRKSFGEGKHHDIELIKFVALHELAHIANSIPGTENHGPEFWRTFKLLLEEARENGLATKLKTRNGVITYCDNITLTDEHLNLYDLNI